MTTLMCGLSKSRSKEIKWIRPFASFKNQQRTGTMFAPKVRPFHIILLVGEFSPSRQTWYPKLIGDLSDLV